MLIPHQGLLFYGLHYGGLCAKARRVRDCRIRRSFLYRHSGAGDHPEETVVCLQSSRREGEPIYCSAWTGLCPRTSYLVPDEGASGFDKAMDLMWMAIFLEGMNTRCSV